MRAELQNIDKVTLPSDYSLHIVFKCSSCNEETSKAVVFTAEDKIEGIRGSSVNLRLKCGFCSRTSEISIVDKPFHYEGSGWKPLCILECRGMVPEKWILSDDPWTVIAESGAEIDDVVLEDSEYFGFDEKGMTEISITEFESKFERA